MLDIIKARIEPETIENNDNKIIIFREILFIILSGTPKIFKQLKLDVLSYNISQKVKTLYIIDNDKISQIYFGW